MRKYLLRFLHWLSLILADRSAPQLLSSKEDTDIIVKKDSVLLEVQDNFFQDIMQEAVNELEKENKEKLKNFFQPHQVKDYFKRLFKVMSSEKPSSNGDVYIGWHQLSLSQNLMKDFYRLVEMEFKPLEISVRISNTDIMMINKDQFDNAIKHITSKSYVDLDEKIRANFHSGIYR